MNKIKINKLIVHRWMKMRISKNNIRIRQQQQKKKKE